MCEIILEDDNKNYYHLLQEPCKLETMTETGGKEFIVKYGRSNSKPKIKEYRNILDLTMWDQMNDKIKKGYHIVSFKIVNNYHRREEIMRKLLDQNAKI